MTLPTCHATPRASAGRTARAAAPRRARAGRRAFSLIELLVVVSIMVILMSLLVPVVGMVREQVKRTKCMSNLRQLGMVVMAYTNDYGRFPASEGGVAGMYPHALSTIGGATLPGIFVDYASGSPAIFYCPSNAQSRTPATHWPNAGLSMYAMSYGLMPWCSKAFFQVPMPNYAPQPGVNNIVGSDFYATTDAARTTNVVWNHNARGGPAGMNELYGDGRVTWHGSSGTWTNWYKDFGNGFYWWALDWQ